MLNQLLKKYINLFRQNKKFATAIASIFYVMFRYLIAQAEYNKSGWELERKLHQADNIRCEEERARWKSQDSIMSQKIWDKAFNSARERILQPAIDSINQL